MALLVALRLPSRTAAVQAPSRIQLQVNGSCFVACALSAGIGEEVVYRGYLMRQFTAFTGHLPLALLLQAVI